MKITVTQEHIDNGEPGECDACPVALALEDAGFTSPQVDSETLTAVRDGKLYEFRSPESVRDFVIRFDGITPPRGPVDPFEFDLDVTP